MIRSYYELSQLQTFDDRFDYLKLKSPVGRPTFGFQRYLNQRLYQSREWKRARDATIIRDNGCDLGIPGFEIFARPVIHHINVVAIEDIENGNPNVFDLDNLITTTHNTHNAIHYGTESLLKRLPKERYKGDMCPWTIQ
jgi:hypothetical protein